LVPSAKWGCGKTQEGLKRLDRKICFAYPDGTIVNKIALRDATSTEKSLPVGIVVLEGSFTGKNSGLNCRKESKKQTSRLDKQLMTSSRVDADREALQ